MISLVQHQNPLIEWKMQRQGPAPGRGVQSQPPTSAVELGLLSWSNPAARC